MIVPRWLVLVLACASQLASAAESCTGWRAYYIPFTGPTQEYGTSTNAAALCASAVPVRVASDYGGTAGYAITFNAPNPGNPAAWSCEYSVGPAPSTTGYGSGGIDFQNLGATECPADPCEAFAGKKTTRWQRVSALPEPGTAYQDGSANFCGMTLQAISGCQAVVGGMFCGLTYAYGASAAPEESEPDGQVGECAYVNGKKNCAVKPNEDGDDCATISGERFCFDGDVGESSAGPPPANCWSTVGGGLLCSDDAEVLDTEGEPVDHDGIVKSETRNYNYYSSTTVQGSGVTASTPGATGGSAEGSGEMGEGSGGGGSVGDLESVCEGDDCYGEFPQGHIESRFPGVTACMDDFDACVVDGMTALWENAQTTFPLLGFTVNLHAGFAGSTTCPAGAATFDWQGETYDFFAGACDMISDFTALIILLFKIGWSMIGLRILMSGSAS